MHHGQQFGGRGIAFRHRLALGVEEIARAEMADEQEAAVEILRMDFRHADAALGKRMVDGDEGRDGARGVGDLGIGLAVAHRRPERQFGRIHQDALGMSFERHGFVGAGRGVAGEVPSPRKPPAAAVKEVAHGKGSRHPLDSRAVARQTGAAAVASVLQFDQHRRSRQQLFGAVGPLDQHRTGGKGLVEAELVQFGRGREAVKIEMVHRNARVVALHQREGRARHVERLVVGERADQRARKRRLAGAEVARKRQHVACL